MEFVDIRHSGCGLMPTSHHDDIQCDSTPSCVIIYSISHTRVLEFQALNVMLLNTFMFCLYDLYFFYPGFIHIHVD